MWFTDCSYRCGISACMDSPMNSTSLPGVRTASYSGWVGTRTGYKTRVHSYIMTVRFHIQTPAMRLSGFVVET